MKNQKRKRRARAAQPAEPVALTIQVPPDVAAELQRVAACGAIPVDLVASAALKSFTAIDFDHQFDDEGDKLTQTERRTREVQYLLLEPPIASLVATHQSRGLDAELIMAVALITSLSGPDAQAVRDGLRGSRINGAAETSGGFPVSCLIALGIRIAKLSPERQAAVLAAPACDVKGNPPDVWDGLREIPGTVEERRQFRTAKAHAVRVDRRRNPSKN